MHTYVCEKCGQEKKCVISGCLGDCGKWCLMCIRKTPNTQLPKAFTSPIND